MCAPLPSKISFNLLTIGYNKLMITTNNAISHMHDQQKLVVVNTISFRKKQNRYLSLIPNRPRVVIKHSNDANNVLRTSLFTTYNCMFSN